MAQILEGITGCCITHQAGYHRHVFVGRYEDTSCRQVAIGIRSFSACSVRISRRALSRKVKPTVTKPTSQPANHSALAPRCPPLFSCLGKAAINSDPRVRWTVSVSAGTFYRIHTRDFSKLDSTSSPSPLLMDGSPTPTTCPNPVHPSQSSPSTTGRARADEQQLNK